MFLRLVIPSQGINNCGGSYFNIHEIITLFIFIIWHVVSVLFARKWRFDICRSSHSVLFTFYTASQLFWVGIKRTCFQNSIHYFQWKKSYIMISMFLYSLHLLQERRKKNILTIPNLKEALLKKHLTSISQNYQDLAATPVRICRKTDKTHWCIKKMILM